MFTRTRSSGPVLWIERACSSMVRAGDSSNGAAGLETPVGMRGNSAKPSFFWNMATPSRASGALLEGVETSGEV